MLTAGAAILLFAGAAIILSSSNILSMSGGGAQRRLQGATVPLRRLATTDYGNVGPGFCTPYGDPSIIGSPTGVVSPSAEDCSAKCDAEPTCVAFDMTRPFPPQRPETTIPVYCTTISILQRSKTMLVLIKPRAMYLPVRPMPCW